jgi:hypothetical protein
MFSFWLQRQSPHTKEIWLSKLESSHKLCLDFIFGSTNRPTLLTSLAGLSFPSGQLEEWMASLSRQITSLPADHILRGDPPVFTRMMNKNYIATLCGSSSLVRAFHQHLQQLPRGHPRPNWSKFRQLKRLESHLAQPGILQHYIRSEARLPSGADTLFTTMDPEIQRKIYSWRTNTAFLNRTCPCGARFNRAHTTRCNLFDNFPNPQVLRDYTNSLHDIRDDIQSELNANNKGTLSFYYTFLDFCIAYDLAIFSSAFDFLFSKLTSPDANAPIPPHPD